MIFLKITSRVITLPALPRLKNHSSRVIPLDKMAGADDFEQTKNSGFLSESLTVRIVCRLDTAQDVTRSDGSSIEEAASDIMVGAMPKSSRVRVRLQTAASCRLLPPFI